MAKARPSSSEIDRFLEEVNRRKQQQARLAAPPVVQQAPPPRPKAAYVPKAQKVQQRQVILEEPAIRATVVQQQLPDPILEYAPKIRASAYQIDVRPPDMPRGTESAPIHHAKALIKTREGMQAMFVLNEILSPPRCKQPYQRQR